LFGSQSGVVAVLSQVNAKLVNPVPAMKKPGSQIYIATVPIGEEPSPALSGVRLASSTSGRVRQTKNRMLLSKGLQK